ncbi:MAG: TonB-dependent receptor [bacterium]|jgi:iron complex outermembrane receptor protein
MGSSRVPAAGMFPVILSLAFSLAAAESQDTLEVYSVEEIEVKATRIDLPLGSVAPSVDVATRDEIMLNGANSATAAVGYLPGVFIEQTGDFGQADISIRGLGDTGRRVMILMDGHPVKSGLTGATFTQGLTVADIDQIELVRTPGSVIYGSDALGGVVNIVTSPPSTGFALRANTTYGSYNTYKLSAFNSARIRRLGYVLSVDRRQSDGHLPHSEYRGTDFLAKVTGRAGRTNVALLAKYYNGYKEEPAPSSDPPETVSDAWTDYTRGTVDLEVSSRFGGGKSTLKTYVESGDYEFSDGWRSKDKYMGLMAYQTRFIGEMTLLNGGLDFRHQRGEVISPDPGQWSKYEYGFYCLAQFFLKEVAVATAGLRINIDEISGTTPAPHLGIVYDVTDATTLRGSVSGGFRSPQIDELFMFETSNSGLGPETIWSFELGFTHRVASAARLSASVFRIDGQDFIELVPHKGHGNKPVYENVGEIEFSGAEASLSLRPHTSMESRISYAYLDPGRNTAGRPGDKLDVAGIVYIRRFTLLGSLQYVGDYYAADDRQERIDDYLVLNARLSSYVAAGFDAFFSIENITDEEYDIYTSVPGGKTGLYRMPGRRFLVGVTYDLGE